MLSGADALSLGDATETDPDDPVGDGSTLQRTEGGDPQNDAAVEADATTDGGVTGCPGDFCDDFDEGAVGAKWNEAVILGGAVAYDDGGYVSAPQSLRASVPSGTDNVVRRAYLRKNLPVPTSIRCSFSIKINSAYAAGVRYMDFFKLRAEAPNIEEYELRWGVRTGMSALREDVFFSDGGCDCPRKSNDQMPALPVGQWVRVMLETNFTIATVSYDDVQVYSSTFAGFSPTALAIVLGVEHKDKLAMDAQFDDLVCDTTP